MQLLLEVGFVGILVIIVVTSFNGITDEHGLPHAFLECMPFVSLLVVLFAVVAVIHDQHLFKEIIDWVLKQEEETQVSACCRMLSV